MESDTGMIQKMIIASFLQPVAVQATDAPVLITHEHAKLSKYLSEYLYIYTVKEGELSLPSSCEREATALLPLFPTPLPSA